MPRLPQYSATIGGARGSASIGGRPASAADTGGLVGSALQDLGQTGVRAGDRLLTFMEEEDQRKVMVAQAELRAKYAKRLDEAANTGEDLDKIREEFENDQAGIYDGLRTTKGRSTADLYSANGSQIFEARANNIQVTRSVNQARVDGNKFLNSTGAILSTNPGYLPQAEQDVDAFVSTLSNVPPEKRRALADELKQNLNVAAAMTNARNDPEGTKRAVEGGAYFMSPAQRQSVINRADTEIRARRANEEYERAQQDRVKRDLDDRARDEHFKNLFDGTLNLQAVAADDRLRPQTREHLIQLAKSWVRQQQQPVRSDQTVLRDLWLDIHAPEGDPRKIYNADKIFEAVNAGKISPSDANQLNSLVANQKDPNNRSIGSKLSSALSTFGRALSQDPNFIGQPAMVAEIQMDYQARVLDKVEELRGAGKNPADVFNPNSKDYVGSQDFMNQSVKNVRERSQAAGVKGGAVTRGDTVERDGKIWEYRGGDPKRKENWREVGVVGVGRQSVGGQIRPAPGAE